MASEIYGGAAPMGACYYVTDTLTIILIINKYIHMYCYFIMNAIVIEI